MPKVSMESESDVVARAVSINETNETSSSFPDRCFHELFEATALRVPERVALVFGDHQLSYAELNARANQLAHHLRGFGVGPGTCVALCLSRSAEMIVALLGILKAGGAYVPLLPESPKPRLEQQLAETEAPVIVTETRLLGALPSFAGAVVCLDPHARDAGVLAGNPTINPSAGVRPQDLIYVIYTSGSTGTPKGVAVRHDNVVNYGAFIAQVLKLEEHDANGGLSFATVSTLAADLGNTCIFPALMSGGTLHVIDYETAMDGNLFAAYGKKHPIDVLKITPSHLGALLAIPDAADVLPRRYLVTGGEASTWPLVAKVRSLSSLRWINHYGPTETTIGSLTFDLDVEEASVKEVTATVPIGRPIANTRLYVLDEARQPVARGEPGELYIAGRGVTSGYLKQPARTAERFLPECSFDPERRGFDRRMYWTGDRVREVPGGAIEFLGRADDQIKIRGFRVELGEIEAVLRKHPDLGHVVVVAREMRPQDLRIVAYFVAAPGKQLAAAALQQLAREHLAEAMVPSTFVELPALPLTANGKVDKKALPRPDDDGAGLPPAESAAQADPSRSAPADDLEAQITAIWKTILGLRHIAPSKSFFEIGGHSLSAVHMLAEVQKRVGKRVPNQVMLEAPTIQGVVAFLRHGGSSKARRSLVPIQPKGSRPPLFCIHGGGGEVFWYRDISRRLGPPRRADGDVLPRRDPRGLPRGPLLPRGRFLRGQGGLRDRPDATGRGRDRGAARDVRHLGSWLSDEATRRGASAPEAQLDLPAPRPPHRQRVAARARQADALPPRALRSRHAGGKVGDRGHGEGAARKAHGCAGQGGAQGPRARPQLRRRGQQELRAQALSRARRALSLPETGARHRSERDPRLELGGLGPRGPRAPGDPRYDDRGAPGPVPGRGLRAYPRGGAGRLWWASAAHRAGLTTRRTWCS